MNSTFTPQPSAFLFDYPDAAAFGRVVPKNAIYSHANPSPAVRELFVRQVDKIVWLYKLAPETINLKPSPAVPEVQIFSLTLKTAELKTEVLKCIDRAVAFPLIFELRHASRVRLMAAFKRPSEADNSKWVVGETYFESPWLDNASSREQLPLALNMEALYAQLLDRLMPYAARPGEQLPARVARTERILALKREQAKLEARLRAEKQFNRKLAINAELRDLKQELKELLS